jgi:hypothetical protein
MDKQEASGLLEAHVERLRGLPYQQLLDLFEVQAFQILGASGSVYNIELQVFWDDPRSRTNIRVMASVDDGRWPSFFKPITADFIKAPDGSFVGE